MNEYESKIDGLEEGERFMESLIEEENKKWVKKVESDAYLDHQLSENNDSVMTWDEILSFNKNEPITFPKLKELYKEIIETKNFLTEKEKKEEVLFRLLEDEFDWQGFNYSLVDKGIIDSSQLLEWRCSFMGEVVADIVSKKIETFEEAQEKLSDLLVKDNSTQKEIEVSSKKENKEKIVPIDVKFDFIISENVKEWPDKRVENNLLDVIFNTFDCEMSLYEIPQKKTRSSDKKEFYECTFRLNFPLKDNYYTINYEKLDKKFFIKLDEKLQEAENICFELDSVKSSFPEKFYTKSNARIFGK